jgi:uncharacterized protein (DUF58 family)
LEPQPAQSPDAVLRRVELRVARRLDGLLQGERRGRRPGPGSDYTVTRRYEPGDDVRWIDWPLSARVGEPTVRVPELEPVLTAWALVDASPSMAFGTVRTTKLDLAREVLAGLGVVLRRRGDRLGVAVSATGGLDVLRPPRGDRRGLISALSALDQISAPTGTGRTDLAAAISGLGRVLRHRGLVVIVSDFPHSDALEQSLGVLSRRQELLLIETRDPRERDLPPLGPVTFRDVETDRTVLIDTADPRFQERFRAVAAERDRAKLAMFRRVGARHLIVSSDTDWVLPLARTLMRPTPARRIA